MATVEEVAAWIEQEFTTPAELADWMASNAIFGPRFASQFCPLARLMRRQAHQPVEVAPDVWFYVDPETGVVRRLTMGGVARGFRYEFDQGSFPALIGKF